MGARQQWLVSVLAGCLLTLSRSRLSAGTTFRALGWPDLAGCQLSLGQRPSPVDRVPGHVPVLSDMLSETPLGVEFRRSFSQAPFEYTRSFRRRNSARAHMLAVHTRAGARAGLVYASPGNPRGSVAVVARKATLPLTIPRRVFKSSAKDSTRRAFGIALHGVPQGSSALGVSPTARASGGPGPLLLVGKRAAGARVASSPDSDLEAFSHNPTHGSFAPLAFQPSAMTNCANQRFLSY
ncbi:hypothetical protein HN873_055907 [Arachis hypogaea]